MSKGRSKKSESIIIIDEAWAIKPDTNQWQLCSKTSLNGKTVWQPRKYGTLKHLVGVCVEMKIRGSAFTGLAELAERIQEVKDEMNKVLSDNGIDV
jgi:hypothetical protein